MTKRMMLLLSGSAMETFKKLPSTEQKACLKLCSRLDVAAAHPIPGARTQALRAVALSSDYQVVFYYQQNASTFACIYAGKTEDVSHWAACHAVEIHPTTGVLQCYEVLPEEERFGGEDFSKSEASRATQVTPSTTAPKMKTPGLFAAFSDEELLSLSVPTEYVPVLKALKTREDFNAIRSRLPEATLEALVWLLDGEPIESVREAYGASHPTKDLEKAIENPATQRSFLVIESDEAMKQVTNASLERWRIFLHPLQKRLVDRAEDMPSLVRGAAGTGKTVVAMHRAVHLALQPDWRPEDKILFTTYTKNLAADIRAQLDLLFMQSSHWEERNRVEVTNLDAWVVGFLRRNRFPRNIAYRGNTKYNACWKSAMRLVDTALGYSDTFYQEEWDRVVLPNEVRTEKDYLHVSRKGRGTALSRRERKLIWPVFDEMRTQLSDAKLMTIEEACQIAVRILQTHKGMTEYRAVIVDETQDLDDDALKLLARLALPEGDETKEPHIFLVGDGRQRIYARNGSLSACGINVRGRRSERLRLTYRTTEEIRRAANAILAGESYDDMDEGSESDKGDLAIRNGRAPITYVATDAASECAWVAEQIKALRSSLSIDYRDICIVGRTNKIVGDCMEMLNRTYGIPGDRISRNATDDQTKEGVRFATMHRVKGLEFRVVFIVDAGVESPEGNWNTDDPVEQHCRALTERSLRYVAASRAKDVLFISAHGKAPEWMKAIAAMANGSSVEKRATVPTDATELNVSKAPEVDSLPSQSQPEPQPELPTATETKTTRAKRFTFSMVGIPIGATLTFAPTGINVKVVSDSEVEYAGKRYKLSGFTKRFMPDSMRTISDSYRGTLYFTYRGKTLQIWRDRQEAGLGLPDEEQ